VCGIRWITVFAHHEGLERENAFSILLNFEDERLHGLEQGVGLD
jgi:hypothetical protein